MNQKITKISVAFVFAALFVFSVGSAQAAGSVWFTGHDQYRPADIVLNGGSCYNVAHNSENIYLSTDTGLNQKAKAGPCTVTQGRSYNIWLEANTP